MKRGLLKYLLLAPVVVVVSKLGISAARHFLNDVKEKAYLDGWNACLEEYFCEEDV